MIDYEYLVDSAMRVLIKNVLMTVSKNGSLPGAHHFHISFVTKYEGVEMPPFLLEKYPQEITIALHNQFKNLNVYDDNFSVELSFGGQETTIVVPFCAITSFADPSTDFILRMPSDNTGMIGKSKFHEMIHSGGERVKEDTEEVNNVVNFAEIRKLLNP